MNLTSRLEHLFPFLDVRPTDGKISVEELSSWQMAQERKTALHRTMRELEVMDRNGDGHVSIKEYLNDESPGDACEDTLCQKLEHQRLDYENRQTKIDDQRSKIDD